MNIKTAIRWFGFVLVLGGVLGAACSAFPPFGLYGDAALTPAWVPLHVLLVLGNILLGIGLFGLYLPQANRIGWLGFVAFLLAVLAANVSIAVSAIEAYVYPEIAAAHPTMLLSDFIAKGGPLFLVRTLDFGFLILYEPGMILLSILTLRSGDYSRVACWLLIIGSIGSNAILFANGTDTPAMIATYTAKAFMIIWSLALAWLGYQVWRGHVAQQVSLQPADMKA